MSATTLPGATILEVGTWGIREVAWWSDFFAKTRPVRMQMAEAICEAVYAPDVQQRLKDVRPQVAEQLARMHAEHHSEERSERDLSVSPSLLALHPRTRLSACVEVGHAGPDVGLAVDERPAGRVGHQRLGRGAS